MQSYTYLMINLGSIIIPLLFSFHPQLRVAARWREVWPAIFITAALFILWDIPFAKMGIWGFNPDYLIGCYLFGLPVEEWLFFICIPYACLFTYICLGKLAVIGQRRRPMNGALIFLSTLFLLTGLISLGKAYTSTTLIATSGFLFFLWRFAKPAYLPQFFLAYLVIFAGPFLLVNGLLTGSFLAEPIVWYNNAENLGIRVFTIPVEDFVYGFLLYLMNVTIYEYLFARAANRKNFRHKPHDAQMQAAAPGANSV